MEKDNIPEIAEITAINDVPEQEAEDQDTFEVTFSKPYRFEGKVYEKIDLSGLQDLTAEDMIQAEKYLTRNGGISSTPELTVAYVCYIAAKASDMPVEFFRRLTPKDVIKVKNRVTLFFYAED